VQLAKVPVDSLQHDPENARSHSIRNIEAIKGSLAAFGQRRPLVVWENIVIAGNGTLTAAKALKWTDIIITRVPPDWTYDQARAFALADNRTAELAEWDATKLADQLLELDAVGFDVSEWGFDALTPPLDPEPLDDYPVNPPCPTCGRPL
jgi:ParB-like chromosome segregation protein Spo0J